MFGDLIVRYLPQIRKLKFADVNGEGFCQFPEFNWLPDLQRLDTLVISDLYSIPSLTMVPLSEDEEMAPFYKNPTVPMASLKRRELEGYWNSESFKKVFDFFPCLETLTISAAAYCFTLPIQDLISVVNSFGDVKNLSLSNFKIRLTGLESYDATIESNILQEAVKIIDGKFPVETTQIKICGKKNIAIIKEKGIQPFMKVL